MRTEFVAKLKPEDLPTDELQHIAEIIGVEKLIKLLDMFGGTYVYFPLRWRTKLIEKFILEEWDGEGGPQAIAHHLGVSRSLVYEILKKPTDKPQVKSEIQTSLL